MIVTDLIPLALKSGLYTVIFFQYFLGTVKWEFIILAGILQELDTFLIRRPKLPFPKSEV